jgi:SAM-dependent methyltransferase
MPAPAGYQPADWYDTPLYYDIIFDDGTEQEANFLEAAFAKHSQVYRRSKSNLRVLEPACGSGRLMARLAKRGHTVTGFDLNPKMLEAARKRLAALGNKGTLKRQRLESFEVAGTFDLAHCLLSTFKYILNEDGAVSHLNAVSRHVKPGGLYILGIHLTDYTRTSYEHERWTGSRNGIDVICNTRTWPPIRRTRREILRNRLRVTSPGGSEKLLETNWECRTYDAAQLRRTLRKVRDLTPVAYYDFHYDLSAPSLGAALSDDVVVILRKNS